MGVLSLVHAPGRYDNLRRIRSLDPEVDHDEILRLTARFEFPWDYVQGTGIAFMRDYGVPSIAGLLDRTREFEDHGVKRYDDTILIGDEATLDGIDSPRSHAALRRLNRIHGHYDIAAEDFAYVLATTIVGLMPLAVSTTQVGGDGPPYFPMARAIIGGLAFSTVVSLLVVPAFYAYFDSLSAWGRKV